MSSSQRLQSHVLLDAFDHRLHSPMLHKVAQCKPYTGVGLARVDENCSNMAQRIMRTL
jgi:hypothetical protein